MAVDLENVVAPELHSTLDSTPTSADPHREDLTQIIRAYNQVTENLQLSHEALKQQVIRLQQDLASSDAQLRRSKQLAALGEMATGIAHEIRNPLGAIQLYASMLVEDLTAATAKPAEQCRSEGGGSRSQPDLSGCAQTAGKIASAVRGLNAIVDDVLSFARQIVPRRSTVKVASLFDRAIESQRPAIDVAQIQIQSRPIDDVPSFLADPHLLHQAMVNLIRNAVDSMSGLPQRRVLSLAARDDSCHIVLTVRDTGPGIQDQDIDRIFNPFFTTRDTGTGLGLAIVHRIAEAHGGTICVHNDHGAVFELNLPKHSNHPELACVSERIVGGSLPLSKGGLEGVDHG